MTTLSQPNIQSFVRTVWNCSLRHLFHSGSLFDSRSLLGQGSQFWTTLVRRVEANIDTTENSDYVVSLLSFKELNLEWEAGAKIRNKFDGESRRRNIFKNDLGSQLASFEFVRTRHQIVSLFVNSANSKHSKEQGKFRRICSRQTDKKWLRRCTKVEAYKIRESSPTHSKIQD